MRVVGELRNQHIIIVNNYKFNYIDIRTRWKKVKKFNFINKDEIMNIRELKKKSTLWKEYRTYKIKRTGPSTPAPDP